MVRPYFFAAILLLGATLVFWGERFAVHYRIASLADKRFENLKSDIEQLDASMETRNRQGDFFRYLGAKESPLAADRRSAEMRELNQYSDVAESVIVLDNRFETRARSGRDLTDSERQSVRQVLQASVLCETGILRRYAITDFNGNRLGYAVLIIRPDMKLFAATMFAASLDFQTVAALSRDNFDHEEKKLISVLLARQTTHDYTLTVRGESYLSSRRTWLEENTILFQITPLPPLYSYISLYLSPLLFLLAVVSVIRARRELGHSRREISERILATHTRSLQAQNEMLSELGKIGEIDREKVISENLFVDDAEDRLATVESKIREGYAVYSKVKPPQAAPIVVEVASQEREFRFMNPSLARLPEFASPALGERERELRSRAFSDELKTLMSAMEAPADRLPGGDAGGGHLMAAIDAFEKKYKYPNIDQYVYYLNELYFDEVTGAELQEAMRAVGDAVQSQDFAILLYDPALAAYKTGLTQGVPKDLQTLFYLLPQDAVLTNDVPDYAYIEMTPLLRKNPYLTKRLPANFADSLKGLHIFALSESFLRARVVFFDSARGGALKDDDQVTIVKGYLRQVAPAIEMYFKEHSTEVGNPLDLAAWAVLELKECLALTAEGAPLISQYVFEKALSLDAHLTLMRRIAEIIEGDDRILLLSPARLVVVHGADTSKQIEDIVGAVGSKFIIKESVFGKTTRNLYTFVEF